MLVATDTSSHTASHDQFLSFPHHPQIHNFAQKAKVMDFSFNSVELTLSYLIFTVSAPTFNTYIWSELHGLRTETRTL